MLGAFAPLSSAVNRDSFVVFSGGVTSVATAQLFCHWKSTKSVSFIWKELPQAEEETVQAQRAAAQERQRKR